jgi:flagellar hook protein FlgE
MSIGGMMRTSISGMQAQSNRLSAVADNIANSDTNGYKRLRTDFSSMVLSSGGGRMASGAMSSAGGVLTSTRQLVSQQGSFEPSSSTTDLAIQGNGFFVVQDGSGTPYFTRAGSFVPDANGTLINASGYNLLGYSLTNGSANAVANGFAGLQPVSIAGSALIATATTEGTFAANLPADAPIATAPLPSANAATSASTNKSSLLAYDNLGRGVVLDVYMTKTATGTWEVAVFNQSDAATGGGFPYSAGPLATQTLSFSPTNGMLASTSANSVSLTVPGGSAMTIDMANMTQLATTFTVSDADTNGNPPSGVEQVDIDDDGTLYARYGDGSYRALYRIPLATVTSPDQMTALTGTIFAPNPQSGAVTIGFANEGAMGKIISSSLEQSNVDIADELTTMIQSQRSYTANSKVFQTGSELMDVVVNLKR